jgi:hypothetical protein
MDSQLEQPVRPVGELLPSCGHYLAMGVSSRGVSRDRVGVFGRAVPRVRSVP